MPLSASSVKKYNEDIERLKKHTGTTDIFDTSVMIPGVKSIKKDNGGDYVLTSLRGFFIALAYMTKSNAEIYDIYKSEIGILNKKIELQETTTPDIPYSLIQRIGKVIMNNEKEPLENRILAGFITQMEPLRLDYTNLLINPAKDYKSNYIHLGDTAAASHIVVQKHKTAKRYGPLNRILTEPVFTLVKKWNDENPRGILLNITESGLSYRIGSLFLRYVKTKITMNDIRHSYITEHRKGDRTKKEVEKIAHSLGHSASMNMDYRRD